MCYFIFPLSAFSIIATHNNAKRTTQDLRVVFDVLDTGGTNPYVHAVGEALRQVGLFRGGGGVTTAELRAKRGIVLGCVVWCCVVCVRLCVACLYVNVFVCLSVTRVCIICLCV